MPANLENSAVAAGLEKVRFHSNHKERQCQCSNYRTIVLISHSSKVMLKILQDRLQQYMTFYFQMFEVDLEKEEETEIKLPTFLRTLKERIPEKLLFLLY